MQSRVIVALLLLVAALFFTTSAQQGTLTLVDVHQYIVNTAGDYKGALKTAQLKLDLLVEEQKQRVKDAEALQAEIQLIDTIIGHVKDMTTTSASKQQIMTLLENIRKSIIDSLSTTSIETSITQAQAELQQATQKSQYIEALMKAVADAQAKLATPCTSATTSPAPGNTILGASSSESVKIPETNIKYYLANGVDLVNTVGVKVVGNTIVKTDTKAEYSTFFSSSSLVTEKQDYRGIYFEAVSADKRLAVGLSRVYNVNVKDPQQFEYTFILEDNGEVKVFEKGWRLYLASTYVAGDSFAIEYRNSQIEFSQNGLLIYSSTLSPSFPLSCVSSMFTPGAAIKNLLFTKERPSAPSLFAHPDEPAIFKNVLGLGADWGKITKTAPLSSEWNSNAFSVQKISPDQAVNGIEFTPMQDDKTIIIGLSSIDGNAVADSIDFGVLFQPSGKANVYERNSNKGPLMTYQVGDRFSIVIDELGMVVYRVNDVAFYTSQAKPVFPLYIDASALSNKASIQNIKFISVPAANHVVELGEHITFTAIQGLAAVNGNLQKISMGASDWDTGAFSVNPIDPQNTPARGFSFSVGQTTGALAIGLSNTNAGVGYSTIDYSLYFTVTGFASVIERNTFRSVNMPYSVDDQFALIVRFGKVHYVKNGKTFYTSPTTPTFPLYVDASILTRGASIKNIRYIDDYETAPKTQDVGDKIYFIAGFVQGAMSGPGVLEKISLPEYQGIARTAAVIDKDSKIQGVEFKCGSLTSQATVSLVNSGQLQSFTLECNTQHTVLQVLENGAARGFFGGRFTTSDVLGIRINEFGRVEFLKNGLAYYESQMTPSLPLAIEVTLAGERSSIYDATYIAGPQPRVQVMSPGVPVVFRDFIGMSTADNNGVQMVGIFRSSYYAGAISLLPITETSAVNGVEVVIAGKFDSFLALTNTTFVDPTYKYPFSLNIPSASTTLTPYENGAGLSTKTQFAIGDKIGIKVEGGKVLYTKNGAVFATSTRTPSFPLYVVASSMYPGNSFSDIRYTGQEKSQ